MGGWGRLGGAARPWLVLGDCDRLVGAGQPRQLLGGCGSPQLPCPPPRLPPRPRRPLLGHPGACHQAWTHQEPAIRAARGRGKRRHARVRACVRLHVRKCVWECFRACIRARVRKCVWECVRVCMRACVRVCACVLACVRACVRVCARACASADVRACTCVFISRQQALLRAALKQAHLMIRWRMGSVEMARLCASLWPRGRRGTLQTASAQAADGWLPSQSF